MTMDPDLLIDEKLADRSSQSLDDQLVEAPLQIRLIWKKLPPKLRSRVNLDLLRDFLTAVVDDELSAKDAASQVGLPLSVATELWQGVERTGLV